jgi:hypothetical protein
MNLQQFEKLLCEHLPLHRVRRIIRIYLDVAGEGIDSGTPSLIANTEAITDIFEND